MTAEPKSTPYLEAWAVVRAARAAWAAAWVARAWARDAARDASDTAWEAADAAWDAQNRHLEERFFALDRVSP